MVISVALILTPWDWHFGYKPDENDGFQVLALGPFMITFDADAFGDDNDFV